MKLSNLISARNILVEQRSRDACEASLKNILNIYDVMRSLPISHKDVIPELEQVSKSLIAFHEAIADQINQYNVMIKEREAEYFAASTRLYSEEMCYESTEYILNRKLPVNDEIKKFIKTRLNRLVHSFYPGAIIRPAREEFVKDMVGYSPLYVLDQNMDLLAPSIENFNEAYQNRLCAYTFKESTDQPMLDSLPDNQFGAFFIYGYFNFRPIEIVQAFLKEIYQKLKPGGFVAFTYNDCNFMHGILSTEKSYTCYMNGDHIRQYARYLGFEVLYEFHNDGIDWLELKKPGELQSMRGGQCYARISRHAD